MDKQKEIYPWCQKEVWVEPTHPQLYRCTAGGKDFNFAPGTAPATPGARAHESKITTWQPPELVETPFLKDLMERALAYLREGLPVHLAGPAGCGKTTLALCLAHRLGRPVVLIHGDEQMDTSDLVGDENGYKGTYPRDNFIPTALKLTEEVQPAWANRTLTEACREGYTVVYDEFTRSRPEANNVLLSVLEERVLPLWGGPLPVHPAFSIIFTSNPEEYAGVHSVQDAFCDRMVTIPLNGFDQDTEVAIAQARSGLPQAEVERIVALVRAFRKTVLKSNSSSIRPCIFIARILRARGGRAYAGDPVFTQACQDVLISLARRTGQGFGKDPDPEETLLRLIRETCSTPLPQELPAPEAPLSGLEPSNLMAELMQDREFKELLLRKMLEKALAGKLPWNGLGVGEALTA